MVVSRLITDSEGEGVPLSRGNASGGLGENIIRMFSLGVLPNPKLNLNKMITN